jgi:hypothetical protein
MLRALPDRVMSRQRSNSVAFGAKRTFGEPALMNPICEYAPKYMGGSVHRDAGVSSLSARSSPIL